MEVETFLAIPENRAAVEEIVGKVLAQIAPDEVEITDEFLEPLLDLIAEGVTPSFDRSDAAISFGGLDLMIQVVVPTVVGVLANLLSALGVETVKALHERGRRAVDPPLEAQLGEAKRLIRRSRSPRGKKRADEIAQTVLAAIAASTTTDPEKK